MVSFKQSMVLNLEGIICSISTVSHWCCKLAPLWITYSTTTQAWLDRYVEDLNIPHKVKCTVIFLEFFPDYEPCGVKHNLPMGKKDVTRFRYWATLKYYPTGVSQVVYYWQQYGGLILTLVGFIATRMEYMNGWICKKLSYWGKPWYCQSNIFWKGLHVDIMGTTVYLWLISAYVFLCTSLVNLHQLFLSRAKE